MKPVAQAAPSDPNVNLPPAVARLAAAADAAIAAQNPAPPEPTPPIPQPAPVAAAPDPTPAPAPTPPAPQPDDESWEQKFKSVNGRYTRMVKDYEDANARIDSLQNMIASMQSAPAPTPSAPVQTALKRVTQEEIDTYGPEFFDAVGKRAEEIVAPLMDELRSRLDQVDGKVTRTITVNAESARDKMVSTLNERVPPWRQVNDAPEFLMWLSKPDVYSGIKRHDLLTKAWEANNTSVVLAFFNGFLSEEAALAPPSASATLEPAAAPQPPSSKVPLEDLAAPGRARTAAPSPAPAEKPYITNAQISHFYLDVQKGKYRGRDEEKDAMEAEIFEAMRTGRIRH